MAALYRDDKKLKLKIAYSNLASKQSADYRDIERRLYTLDELAYEIVDGESALTVALVRDMLDELASDVRVDPPDDMLDGNVDTVSACCSTLTALDRAYLARRILDNSRERGRAELVLPKLYRGVYDGDENRFAYVHNPYSDVACEMFSSLTREPRVLYADSFRAACEAVYQGDARYAILPLGNSGEYRLKSFYSLIDSFSLRICAAASVAHNDSEETTVFGMLTLTEPELPSHGDDSYRMDIKLQTMRTGAWEVLLAAQTYGLECLGIEAVPASLGGTADITLGGDAQGCEYMRAYLGIFAPSATLTGIYKEINNTEV